MHYRWFAQTEVASGSSVQLRETWTVLEACHEHVFQYFAGEESPANPPSSYATIRLVCEKLGSNLKAHIRIYKQIPAGGTEAELPAVRGQQAQTWDDPPELVALRALTGKGSQITPRLLDSKITSQGESGFVPGGFLNYVVWEVVPGRRLASRITVEENTFWTMEPDKRELIRQQFRKNYLQLCKWGYMPLHGRASRLVWDAESATLYFIDFFMARTTDKKEKWCPLRWTGWGLAKRPYSMAGGQLWDRSTQDWEW